MNPLIRLTGEGQSVWLDYIRRDLLAGGGLKRMIVEDGVTGVTSNPSIFEKALADSQDYEGMIASESPRCSTAKELYERLAVRDIRDAAWELRDVYDGTHRADGYVSLEVSPELARDTAGTLEEARRLWMTVGRENVLIKVPGTPEGITAFEQLIAEGINVNVTLLFGLDAYESVATGYVRGVARRIASGGDPRRIASVASFFVSRIDTAVDAIIEEKLSSAAGTPDESALRGLLGKAAIANARLAYARFLDVFGGEEWKALAAKGARSQRVLWASTSAKNPAYRDVVYVEELIGPDTVNTIPLKTLEAFRDHGRVRPSLLEDPSGARDVLSELGRLGISMDAVTRRLLDDGLVLFSDSFRKLLAALDRAREKVVVAAG